jgi:hypothetical protein
MAAKWHPTSLTVLPTDLGIEIAGHLAMTLERPMDDLYNLRATCSSVRRICSNPNVYHWFGSDEVWQNHWNHMAHMCLPLSFKLLIATHTSLTTLVVCRVSSGEPESFTFYNSYRINKGVVTTLQHLI